VKSDSPKCPDEVKDDDDSVDGYVVASLELLLSDSKKFHPWKWWNLSVVRMLLASHLNHLKAFGNSKQDASWLEKQKIKAKSKFELDQKNREDKIARKRAVEEHERMEAAKNRKVVAEASDRLVSCFEAVAKKESGADMKDEIKNIKDHMQQMDDRFGTLDNKLGSLDTKFDALLALLQRNNNSNYCFLSQLLNK
jgi:hypothetical protein